MSVSVSVIIPCYNGERYVGETIESVRAQSVEDLEVIVVDDGSTDDSAAVVSRLASADQRVRLISKENGGVAAARNTGFAASSPDARHVLFLDADDLLLPDAVRRLTARLDGDGDLVAAFGFCSRMDESGTPIAPAPVEFAVAEADDGTIRHRHGVDRIGYWNIAPITPISTPGQVVIRRTAMPADGPFDPACVPCEDWDLWLRLARRGDFGVEPVEVLRYRDHVSSASKHHELMQRQRETVLRKQARVVGSAEQGRLRTAWRHAMYGFDARLCLTWAIESVSHREVVGAARYAARSAKYGARWLVARVTGRPDLSAAG